MEQLMVVLVAEKYMHDFLAAMADGEPAVDHLLMRVQVLVILHKVLKQRHLPENLVELSKVQHLLMVLEANHVLSQQEHISHRLVALHFGLSVFYHFKSGVDQQSL